MVHVVSPPSGPLPAARTLQTGSGRLSYMISGRGPSILLFSGAGVSMAGWRPLYPAIERLGTVFAWNRFGMQGSDAPQARQDGTLVLGALRELLAHTRVQPPYVLVAHSLGGLYANLFARRYPQETSGVLLIEATHPDDRGVLRKHESQLVRALGRVLELPQRLFQRNVHAELQSVDRLAREVATAGPFPAVPLRVVTGGLTPRAWMLSPGAIGARRAHQQELARLSPMGQQVIAHRSGHFPQLTEPDVVQRVLGDLLEACAWEFTELRA